MLDSGPTVEIHPIRDIRTRDDHGQPIPVSVNYFPHRQCNYACKFCFHTALSSNKLKLEKAQEGLRLLKAAGMQRLNISGGEPFLHPEFLGKLFRYAKVELGVDTGVICNGSKVTDQWLDKYGQYLDWMGVSCDSFNEDTNELIGRRDGSKRHGEHWRRVQRIAEYCHARMPPLKFKMNTVVNRYNVEEDMNSALEVLKPQRWKVFQVLLLEGENTGPGALRNADDLVVSNEEFQRFLERHKAHNPVAEDNDAMENSYLLLDEEMRFLNCQGGKKIPGRSIFEVGVHAALAGAGWEPETFEDRGGIYDFGGQEPPRSLPEALVF